MNDLQRLLNNAIHACDDGAYYARQLGRTGVADKLEEALSLVEMALDELH